jgi:hypothetical protein
MTYFFAKNPVHEQVQPHVIPQQSAAFLVARSSFAPPVKEQVQLQEAEQFSALLEADIAGMLSRFMPVHEQLQEQVMPPQSAALAPSSASLWAIPVHAHVQAQVIPPQLAILA